MKSPVRFMARGLAEDGGDEKRYSDGGRECRRQRRRRRSGRGGTRQAPALRPAIIQ